MKKIEFANINCLNIVKEWLIKNKCNGLVSKYGVCSCDISNLTVCNRDFSQCVPCANVEKTH
jgi:hypothetical protein